MSTTSVSSFGSPMYTTEPIHMYPIQSNTPVRAKRRQVKNACTKCQKSCKKCDDSRPCLRCVRYGLPGECISSVRKERKSGGARGPYKKRGRKCRRGNADVPQDTSPELTGSLTTPPPPPPGLTFVGPYYPPPPFYGGGGAPAGEGGPPYPQFYYYPPPPPNEEDQYPYYMGPSM